MANRQQKKEFTMKIRYFVLFVFAWLILSWVIDIVTESEIVTKIENNVKKR